MAHYAFLDNSNPPKVTEVIVGKEESDTRYDWEMFYGAEKRQVCKRTSYNTRGGVHLEGGTPFRKNYAGIGYTYDAERDAFIPPKPYESWTLNEDTCLWEPPTPMPEGQHYWDEDSQSWLPVE